MASALKTLMQMVWRGAPTAPDGKTDLDASGAVY